jgi:pheromone shutdown protein TraB
MTQMRNNFFVLKFLEIYEQIKNENRPIILRIGQAHLKGVSELLKSQGISHTCVDLEKMTSTKVTIETEKEFHNHDEL